MTGFACSAAVFALAAYLAIRGWRRRDDSPLFVLRLLPPALLFASLGALLAAVGIVLGLQRIAATGTGGFAEARAIALEALRALQLGALGAVIGAAVAAGLQAFATGFADAPQDDAPPHDRAETGILLAGVAVALPTAYLAWAVRVVANQLMDAAVAVTAQDATRAPLPVPVDQVSSYLAAQLVHAVTIGAATTLGLFLLTAGTLFFARSRRRSGSLALGSWVVVALLCGAGLVAAYELEQDIREIDAIEARP